MTKEITKAYILQQIQDKFKLRELEPARFEFSETVVPTYDIGKHLLTWETIHSIKSITSAAAYTFFNVPETEQWTLRGYMLIFYNIGAYQVSGVYLTFRPAVGDYIYLDLKENQAASYIVNLPSPVILNAGTKINVLVDTYVSTANLGLYVDVQKEEIR